MNDLSSRFWTIAGKFILPSIRINTKLEAFPMYIICKSFDSWRKCFWIRNQLTLWNKVSHTKEFDMIHSLKILPTPFGCMQGQERGWGCVRFYFYAFWSKKKKNHFLLKVSDFLCNQQIVHWKKMQFYWSHWKQIIHWQVKRQFKTNKNKNYNLKGNGTQLTFASRVIKDQQSSASNELE